MGNGTGLKPANSAAVGPSERAILGRQALYSAVAGALGVMVAWLIWIAMQAWHQSGPKVVVPALVGAVAVVLYERLEKHVRVARRESEGGPAPAEPQGEAREKPGYGRMIGVAGVIGVAFGGVCTNLVGDLMSRMVAPFLVVLVTLAPVGAWFGFIFEAWETDSVLGTAMRGLVAGAVAGVIAFLAAVAVGLGSFDSGQALGMFGWWALMGLGWSFTFGHEDAPRPLAPLFGTLVAGLLVWVSAAPASTGTASFVRPLTDRLAGYALAYPGLPGRFWERAVADYEREHAAKEAATADKPGSPKVRIGVGKPEFVAKTPEEQRLRVLNHELRRGTQSGLLRSWMVLLLFSVGVGVAHWAEPRLRARDYGRSITRMRDRQLAWLLCGLWLASVAGVWIIPW